MVPESRIGATWPNNYAIAWICGTPIRRDAHTASSHHEYDRSLDPIGSGSRSSGQRIDMHGSASCVDGSILDQSGPWIAIAEVPCRIAQCWSMDQFYDSISVGHMVARVKNIVVHQQSSSETYALQRLSSPLPNLDGTWI